MHTSIFRQRSQGIEVRPFDSMHRANASLFDFFALTLALTFMTHSQLTYAPAASPQV